MKNILLTVSILLGAVAITLGVVSYTKTPDVIVGQQGIQGPQGERGLQGPAGRDGKDGKDGKDAPVRFGAASPDISSPYFSYGDVRHWGIRDESLAQATTTICALQAPASTSTLTFASVQLKVSSTTQSRVVIAKATTAFATTTSLGSAVFAANSQGTLIATSTPADALNEDKTFAPNTWLVVGMQGGIGTFSPTGTCVATWVEN